MKIAHFIMLLNSATLWDSLPDNSIPYCADHLFVNI